MTADEFNAALALAGVTGGDDWQEVPDGKLLTLHVASSGVGLGIAKIVAVRVVGGQAHARTSKGDLCVCSVADVFACAVDHGESRGRKAGFSQ